jgi:hypothetical protein
MLFLKGSHRYLCQLVKFVMTARVIELGSRASYTLRARSPPQHRSLGNVPVMLHVRACSPLGDLMPQHKLRVSGLRLKL